MASPSAKSNGLFSRGPSAGTWRGGVAAGCGGCREAASATLAERTQALRAGVCDRIEDNPVALAA